MEDIRHLLLQALDSLGQEDFVRLRYYLMDGVEGFEGIPRYKLDNADRTGTADVMIQIYGRSKSAEITLIILKKMRQNQVAEDLSSKLSKSNGDYGLLVEQHKTTVEKRDEKMPGSFLSIAVHIGTSYTGYCYTFKEASQVQFPRWYLQHGFSTCKTPTCILFDENEDFMSFGYDAMMTYTKTAAWKQREIYFFENFRVQIEDKAVHTDLMLTANNGKQMKAIKVFTESLICIKDHALKLIRENTGGRTYLPSDATWVLTVPAVWRAAAKQFMREAATQAGLVTEPDSERLIICPEPEAAIVFCTQLPREGFLGEGVDTVEALDQHPGTKLMVVKCGGWAMDITVHEVLEGGRLMEIHSVSESSMGGQCVDRNFKSFLRELFTEDIFDEYEKIFPSGLQSMMYEFTIYKRYDGDVMIQCPHNLQILAQKKQAMSAYFKSQQGAEWDAGKMKLLSSKLRSFYDDVLNALKFKINEILNNFNLNTDYVLLVGGFALSNNVRSFVKQQFDSTCKVLCPCDAETAIMKGAVMFGTKPNVFTS